MNIRSFNNLTTEQQLYYFLKYLAKKNNINFIMLNLPKPGNSEIDEHKPETENGVPRVKPMAPEIAPSGALSRDHSSTDNAHALLGKRDKPEPAIADKDFRMIPPHD